MKKKLLYVLVEGNHDTSFIETFIRDRKCLAHKYRTVICEEYGEGADEGKIQRYIKSYEEAGDDYLLLVDADFDEKSMTIKEKEKAISKELGIPINKIWIVINEIESWMLAGFDEKFCNRHSLKFHRQTDRITKEDFIAMARKKYKKREEASLRKFLTFTRKNDFTFKEVVQKHRNQSLKKFYNHFELSC